jgi:sugar phosphate isomerase/epimerase
MRIGGAHLGYCTNIHPGEGWAEVMDNLRHHVVAVKGRVAPEVPLGVGLRLSARAAAELARGEALSELGAWLADHGLYVFTVNGFPYGSFHGVRVKEQVYRPDWLEDERLTYSALLADILARLLPSDVAFGSVSTVPGAFKPRAREPDAADRIAKRLVDHAAGLRRLENDSGKRIVLALEPEPCCLLETVEETRAFFAERLFDRAQVARFGTSCGLAGAAAEEALRQHLGICLDACHMAVEFEPMAQALAAFRGAGIAVPKIQVSAGLEVSADAAPAVIEDLARFDEPVYLHQVVEQRAEECVRYLDLGEALGAARRGERRGPWRIHFHVPLFHAMLGDVGSTRHETAALLGLLAERGDGLHLEAETYTWDVLPPEHRALAIDEAIARELAWTRSHLVP